MKKIFIKNLKGLFLYYKKYIKILKLEIKYAYKI